MQAGPVAESGAGGVKEGNKEIEELRRKCKNTLFVACAVLSMPGLQNPTRLITAFCQPVFSAHSSHARDCREPAK
eukprot:3621743-Lingulodinium_polyedra.AAC.1